MGCRREQPKLVAPRAKSREAGCPGGLQKPEETLPAGRPWPLIRYPGGTSRDEAAVPMNPEKKIVPDANREGGMTARDTRLRKHAEYQRVYQASRKQFSGAMTWFAARREDSGVRTEVTGPRVGLTVGKVLGKAVDRNRIKRRMRAAVRANLGELPAGVDVILHPKRLVRDAEFGKLQSEVQRIFRQAAAQVRAAATRGGGIPPAEKKA